MQLATITAAIAHGGSPPEAFTAMDSGGDGGAGGEGGDGGARGGGGGDSGGDGGDGGLSGNVLHVSSASERSAQTVSGSAALVHPAGIATFRMYAHVLGLSLGLATHVYVDVVSSEATLLPAGWSAATITFPAVFT